MPVFGIEHEGMPGDGLTKDQYEASLWLHRQLIRKWKIPVDHDHIIGHYRIDSINKAFCPGPGFPWDRLFNDIGGKKIMVESWKMNIINEAKNTGFISSVDHDPDTKLGELPLWFLLALFINTIRVVKS